MNMSADARRRARLASWLILPWLLVSGGMADAVERAAAGMNAVAPADDANNAASGYSALAQVDHGNVWRLQTAWKWPAGNPAGGAESAQANAGAGFPSAPRILPEAAGGTLLFCADASHLQALDPATGRELWRAAQPCTGFIYRHDPSRNPSRNPSRDPSATPATRPCTHRLLSDSGDGHLLAIDALTGERCTAAREAGSRGDRMITTGIAPPVSLGNSVVLAYQESGQAAPGNAGQAGLMAMDADTGARRWMTALPGEVHADDLMLAADAAGKLLIIATTTTVSALHGESGALAWQLPMPSGGSRDPGRASRPLLVEIARGHRRIPAVVLIGSRGIVTVLDRTTGLPLPAATDRNLAGPDLTPGDAWGLTFWDQARCRELLSEALLNGNPASGSAGNDGPWISFPTPAEPGTRPGIAFDPARNLLVADLSRLATWFPGKPAGAAGKIFLGPTGMPCTAPPWSIVTAMDLDTGAIHWTEPLGSLPGMMQMMLPGSSKSWSANAGGEPLVTAGGLVFLATSGDRRLHGFELDTGHESWSMQLPAAARGAPLTYQVGDRQYVVIAGGNGAADRYLLAWALPGKYLKSLD